MNYQQFNKKMFVFKQPLDEKKKKERKLLQEVPELPNYRAREPRPHYQTNSVPAACTFILLQAGGEERRDKNKHFYTKKCL